MMRNSRRLVCAALIACAVVASGAVRAIEPADPHLIPEGRRLLEYLLDGRDGRIVSGCQSSGPGSGPFEAWQHASGREPALQGFNIAGFHPVDTDIYHEVLRGTVKKSLFWGQQKGGIVAMLYHWTWANPDGSVSFMKNRLDPVPDLAKLVTPGTQEYEQFHRDLRITADYLEELADAGVPLLFRPFHEIDGGWFWWTDAETPENTAALYRQMFDYLVNERGIHNLIWEFAPAHVAHASRRRIRELHGRTPTIEEEAEYRRRFYPGDDYVDLVSISVYGSSGFYDWGWGGPMEENYASAYELLRAIAPNKPMAVAESPNLLNPAIASREGPEWVYDMSWYGNNRDWMQFTLNHEHFLSLDELPVLHNGNVMPNVRIAWPTDGLAIEAPKGIEIAGFVSDRNGNREGVSVYAISEPLGGGSWLLWNDVPHQDVIGLVEQRGTLLGEAPIGSNGRWTFTLEDIPVGYHQFVALARDTQGAVAHSNVARVTIGAENLASGRPVSASSKDKWGGPPENAVDGDPWTSWWADRNEREEPQWLHVDLGATRTFGAVGTLWWKVYPQDYRVQVSGDGENWREVARAENSGYRPRGVSDVLRFAPARARYVRLLCTKPDPTQSWMTYALFHFGVYESLPEQQAGP